MEMKGAEIQLDSRFRNLESSEIEVFYIVIVEFLFKVEITKTYRRFMVHQ